MISVSFFWRTNVSIDRSCSITYYCISIVTSTWYSQKQCMNKGKKDQIYQ